MSRDLKIRATLAADMSAASSVTAALEDIKARSMGASASVGAMGAASARASGDAVASFSAMRGAVNGLDVAMQGGTESAMGATQAIIAMGRAMASSNPIFAAITIALLAINKILGMATERYERLSKESKESADKAAEFSRAVRQIRASAQETNYSIEKQVAWLNKIAEYYGQAAEAADKWAAAMKRGQSIRAESQIARVDSEEVQAVKRAGKDRFAVERAQLDAEFQRAQIGHANKAAEIGIDREVIRRKIAAAQEAITSMESQRGAPADLARARADLEHRKSQRAGLHGEENRGAWFENEREIIRIEKQLKGLVEQERERRDVLDQQIAEKHTAIQQLQIELRDQDEVRRTLDLQLETTRQRLALQRQENDEAQKAVANAERLKSIEEQRKTIVEQIAAAEKAAADAMATAKEREAAAAAGAKTAWERAMERGGGAKTPQEQIAEAEDRRARGRRRSRDDAILANKQRILAGDDIETVADRARAIARARAAAARGIRGKSIDRLLAADKAQSAADTARQTREQMEIQQAKDISQMRLSLASIEKQLTKNLQLAGGGAPA